jgi:hypothetical protein
MCFGVKKAIALTPEISKREPFPTSKFCQNKHPIFIHRLTEPDRKAFS